MSSEADFETVVGQILRLPISALTYEAAQQFRRHSGADHVQQRSARHFDLEEWASAHGVHCEVVEDVYHQWSVSWSDSRDRLIPHPKNTWWRVQWNDQLIDVIQTTWVSDRCEETCFFLLGDRNAVRALSTEVGRWSARVRDEILVFESGHWRKSKRLFREVAATRLDSLVLRPGLKEDLLSDVSRFFASEDVYDAHGLPWKRGILLLGPPGNGKTHAVKGLINELDIPALYARSFKTRWDTDEQLMALVFDRAREVAPCLLVLEDLDNLVNDDNRSFFLNELDGFALNRGVFTLATSNHPERLDPALLHRPSRFDRKFTFSVPDRSLRRTFLEHWLDRAKLERDPALLDDLVDATESFSFAYLKELVLSAVMKRLSGEEDTPDHQLLRRQAEVLATEVLQGD